MAGVKKYIIFFVFLFFILTAWSLKVHQNVGIHNFRSEIWCDKAGYNVYLPATFIYHYNTEKFPAKIDSITGNGFNLDRIHQKVFTKYPYGVALMQSPFWLCAHTVSGDKSGFSFWYLKSVCVAAVFYLILGLFFLFLTFRNFLDDMKSFMGVLVVLFGTNLIFYGVYDPGMSHVFSFCTISLVIFFIINLQSNWEAYSVKKKLWRYFFISVLISLTVIIRPVNAVFLLLIVLFAGISDWRSMKLRLRILSDYRFIIMVIPVVAVFLAPQLIYYHYLKGNCFIDSYENEYFSHLNSPKILELLFSPNNGLFLYTPVLLLLLAAIVYFIRQKPLLAVVPAVLLLIDFAIYSTWWSVDLGAGYGHRPIVDMLPFLFLPIVMFYKQIKKYKIVVLVFAAITVVINLKIILFYSGCYGGNGYWDWPYFIRILF